MEFLGDKLPDQNGVFDLDRHLVVELIADDGRCRSVVGGHQGGG